MTGLMRRGDPWVALDDDESDAGTRKRGWFWTATVGFVLAAILLPTVMLAVTGHFSHSSGAIDDEAALGSADHQVPADDPFSSAQPSQTTPFPTISPSTGPPFSFAPSLPGATSPPSPPPSISPTRKPSEPPSLEPTQAPTSFPVYQVDETSIAPTTKPPTQSPTVPPTPVPSAVPSKAPSPDPTASPSERPTPLPTESPSSSTTSPTLLPVTYVPGDLTVNENGLFLSTGLTARIVARHKQKVQLHGGGLSARQFHERPDFGATYPVPENDTDNPGGWVYVSNSEMREDGHGGVGAITFDRYGNTLGYKMILTGTTMNCGGGSTPWNTWVSCEEWGSKGKIFQVDPFGRRTPATMTMGDAGGSWESFSYDVRNRDRPRFFATEDAEQGALRRFIPDDPNWEDPWTMLHGNGTMDYLVLEPDGNDGGTFRWVKSLAAARASARLYYGNTEGIDVQGSELFVVAKKIKQMFILQLDEGTYKNESTVHGLFDGQPDQLQRILDDHDIMYFTEEGGRDAGIHARNSQGEYFTILESRKWEDETTGLAFSPNGHHLYLAYQETGILYDVSRTDGLPFHGRSLNVKYHRSS